ncbi:unnamed protein product, partial [Ectocarpus sp. 12 AP-2014]
PLPVLCFPRHRPPPFLPPPVVVAAAAAAAADVEAAAVDPPRQHKAARVKPLFCHASGAPSLWPWGGVRGCRSLTDNASNLSFATRPLAEPNTSRTEQLTRIVVYVCWSQR